MRRLEWNTLSPAARTDALARPKRRRDCAVETLPASIPQHPVAGLESLAGRGKHLPDRPGTLHDAYRMWYVVGVTHGLLDPHVRIDTDEPGLDRNLIGCDSRIERHAAPLIMLGSNPALGTPAVDPLLVAQR